MSLDQVVHNTPSTSQQWSSFYYASMAFVAVTELDSFSTALNCDKYGIDIEKMQFAKYLIEHCGIVSGLLLESALIYPVILGGGYFLNKLSESLDDTIKNTGTIAIGAFTLISIPIIIGNFAQYFSGLNILK